jgi:SAM-dependent methyltransferase
MSQDRERCLQAFEQYYRGHVGALARLAGPGAEGNDAEIFGPAALNRLWDDYCRDSAARLYDSIEKVLPRLGETTRASRPLRILDITCFATTQMLRLRFPGATVHACDKHLKWSGFLDGVECRRCDLESERLPYDDASFDLVVFTETLEHIPRSPYAILGEVKRVLAPAGVLLFSVPNLSSLLNRIRLLMGRNILSVERFHTDSFGHFREYNLSEVEHLLRESGLEVLQAEYVYYASTLRPHGSGLRAARSLGFALVARPLTALIPALRPVCLAIARK